MSTKRSPMSWMLFTMTLVGFGVSAVAYALSRPAAERPEDINLQLLLLLLAISCAASTFGFFQHQVQRYRIALAVRVAMFLLLMPIVAGTRRIEIILLTCLVAEISAFEPYPLNLAIGSGVALVSLMIRFSVFMAGMGLPLTRSLFGQIDYLFLGIFLVAPASLATKYREELIAAIRGRNRLDETVVKLTRLNLEYQNYATSAAEVAMEDERKRITRDIHDIVGYTLTNNIAMMEAATDLMRRNPLGVPALVNAARENAQEGLDLIRDALYRLRASDSSYPTGLRAVARMCGIFGRATGIKVRFECGNAGWVYGDALDSAIYHLIQEALINSFRHGKAEEVTVSLFESDQAVTVSINDDGTGAAHFQEGIGLRGMRERIERLGGKVRIDGLLGGFSILATIPWTDGK